MCNLCGTRIKQEVKPPTGYAFRDGENRGSRRIASTLGYEFDKSDNHVCVICVGSIINAAARTEGFINLGDIHQRQEASERSWRRGFCEGALQTQQNIKIGLGIDEVGKWINDDLVEWVKAEGNGDFEIAPLIQPNIKTDDESLARE